jgi:hypothetical protein
VWVQAVFSIVAIVIAILVPWGQHRRDVKLAQRLRVEDRLRSAEAAGAIVTHAMNLIEDARKGTETPFSGVENCWRMPPVARAEGACW